MLRRGVLLVLRLGLVLGLSVLAVRVLVVVPFPVLL